MIVEGFSELAVTLGLIAAVIVLLLIVFAALLLRAGRRFLKDEQIRHEGIQARAQVITLKQRGGDDGSLQIELGLMLQGGDGSPLGRRTLEVEIPVAHVPAVQPGCWLRVAISATDSSRLVLNESWSRLVEEWKPLTRRG